MLTFLINNAATIIVSVIVLAIVILLIYKMRRDRKSGKSSCGGNCSHCAMGGQCHGNK